MEYWMHMLYLAWLYPAVIMTVWTLLALVVGWTIPLNTRLSPIFGTHVLFFLYNPKDDFLYQRPEIKTAAVLVVIGLVPIAGFVLLVVQSVFYGLGLIFGLSEWCKKLLS